MKSVREKETKSLWLGLVLLSVLVLFGRMGMTNWLPDAQAKKAAKKPKARTTQLSSRKYLRLSKRLVKLRASVDRLTAQIRLERTQHLLALRGKENRRSQLQLLVDQEKLRLQRLRNQRRQLLEKLNTRKRNHKDIRQALKHALSSVKKGILNSLPYRRKERMALLTRIELRLKAGRIDAEQGVAALWRILEDELRLTRIVERAEIPLVLKKGQLPRLVKVVRIGMVALFVKEGKDSFGRMVRDSKGKWRYLHVRKAKDRKQIALLFRNIERQLREGLYRLPLFAPR